VVEHSGTTGPLVAAMQQIADWLKKLGVSSMPSALPKNGIGVAALPVWSK
jgi:hypothetical protein